MIKKLLKTCTLLIPIFGYSDTVIASQYEQNKDIHDYSNSIISGNLPIYPQLEQKNNTYNDKINKKIFHKNMETHNNELCNINPNVQIFKPQVLNKQFKLQSSTSPFLIGTNNEDNAKYNNDLAFTEFFKKYSHPEFLIIIECDGITQTIHALNAEKAIINAYYSQCENINLFNKVNKWIGISYGNIVSGANVGFLSDSKDIDEFTSRINSIISFLEKNRANQYKWYSCLTDCIFNSCLTCVKFNTTADDLEKIRASQFDQLNSNAVKRCISNYFPKKTDERLICLKDGSDRKRIDPDYQSSYTAIINSVNNIANLNNKNVIKKNFNGATDIISTVIDAVKVPVAGSIIKKAGELAGKNLDFKAIENAKNCSHYKEMLDEIYECGTFKLIINVDNSSCKDVTSDIQIEYKPTCNKLKYRLTVNIPETLYQNKNYNFNDGYDKILNYLSRESISYFISPINDFIKNITN